MNNTFRYTKLEITLKASANAEIPSYHGSMLRGVIGRTIKQVSCTNDGEVCEKCSDNMVCPYTKIFYGINNNQQTILGNVDKIPNSFVIEPLMNGQTNIKKDEYLKFNLIIFGNAKNYISYFLHAIYKIKDLGLGASRTKFDVNNIIDTNTGIQIADDKTIYFDKISEIEYIPTNDTHSINDITIYFDTPLRLKSSGKLAQSVNFELFTKSLIRRITLIYDYYEDTEFRINYKELLMQAEDIRVLESNLRWMELERYSSRTDAKVSLGGLIGKVRFRGELSPFYDIIKLGQITHLGKGCVMGLGKYDLIINN